MATISRLDHAVINVRYGLDGAEALFETLGFTLTPRGHHSHGSQNHLMMFDHDYLELIAIPENKQIERRDLLDAPVGINGIVFAADDVDEAYDRLSRLGFAGEPPRAFHRPVTVDGGEHEARFRTVTVRSDVFPAGRVYFCEHLTPDLIWRPEWQHHRNGVCTIVGVVVVTEDAPAEAGRFAALLDTNVDRDELGNDMIRINGFELTVVTPEHYRSRYGQLASDLGDRPAIFGALVLATTDRASVRKAIEARDGLAAIHHPDRTMIRLQTYDALLEIVDAPEAPTVP
ncbi:MAG: VOC family protein [Acidimicrobiales bacterium]